MWDKRLIGALMIFESSFENAARSAALTYTGSASNSYSLLDEDAKKDLMYDRVPIVFGGSFVVELMSAEISAVTAGMRALDKRRDVCGPACPSITAKKIRSPAGASGVKSRSTKA